MVAVARSIRVTPIPKKMPKDPLSTFANTPAEVHAIAHGLHDGYFQKSPGEVPDGIEDVRREQPYYKAAYLLAYLVSKHLSSQGE